MYRPASRALLRTAQSSLAPGRTLAGRRFLTTEPPHLRSRSWKSSATRWGLAIAGIYFYNTSPVFADEPAFNPVDPTKEDLEESSTLSLDSISQRDRSKQRQTSVLESATSATLSDSILHDASTDRESSGSPADLEEEASQQGAFNEETGEINWDCPCLGGMAHGPCGEDFKAAFSCFVFSKEEPKGMDCIDNFKKMQDCFREHPDVYAGELADDDDEIMEEGISAEKAELEREVLERRAAVQEAQARKQNEGEAPQRRLLEEASAQPRPAQRSATKSSSPPPQKQTQAQPPTSSEPHTGMSKDHRERRGTMSEGGPSQAKKPAPPPVQDSGSKVEKFDEDLELHPKAFHDTRDLNRESAEKQ